jgi:arsenical pump membrane protein
MCTVWLANTASLLPVSNLTNLLAVGRVALAPTDFAARMWAAQAASLAVTGVALWAFYWRRGQRETDRCQSGNRPAHRSRCQVTWTVLGAAVPLPGAASRRMSNPLTVLFAQDARSAPGAGVPAAGPGLMVGRYPVSGSGRPNCTVAEVCKPVMSTEPARLWVENPREM